MTCSINGKFRHSIPLLFLLLLNLTIIFTNSRVYATNPTTDLTASDTGLVLLESTTVDQYGPQTVVQGSIEAAVIENATASHPLGGNESLVLKLEELAIFKSIPVGTVGPLSYGWVVDDQLHNFSSHFPSTFMNDYITVVQSIASGNFDEDVAEELIVIGRREEDRPNDYIYDDGRAIIYDDQAHNYTEIQRCNFAKPWCMGTAAYQGGTCPWGARHCYGDCTYFHLSSDVAVGDFDGDGIDEFAIVISERDYDDQDTALDTPSNWDWIIDVYIYDPVEGESNYPYSEDPPQFHWQKYRDDAMDGDVISQPKLAAGELDGDGLDELVLTVAGNAYYRGWIFEYSNGDYSEKEGYSWTNDSEGHQSIHKNEMVLGDIDGDHRDEILYLIRRDGDSGDSIWIKDDETQLYENISCINIAQQTGHELHDDGVLGTGDVDGDGFDEIVVYSLEAGDKFGVVFDDFYHDYKILQQWEPENIASYVSKELTLGDVDADGMDEIILSTGDNHPSYFYTAWGHDEPGTQTAIFDDNSSGYQLLFNDTTSKGFITTGDFDADGVQLTYTGEHWTTIAPPKPVMAIAAPPTYHGIEQNYIDTDTVFGSESSRGAMTGNSIGVSEGTHWSIGVTAELELKIFKAEASFTFRKTVMNEFLRTHTKTETKTIALGYAVGYKADSVIYQIAEFDNYQYEITSHPTNPDAIGQFMTLDVPRGIDLWKTSIASYNNLPSTIVPIGSETFTHTVGQPWTYPNYTSIESIASRRWQATDIEPGDRTQMQSVGQGTGWQKTSIKTETVSTTEMSLKHTTELSYEFEGSMGMGGKDPVSGIGGGVYVTAGAGWTSAFIDVRQSAISVGQSCMYEGIVGDIADEETWDQLKYKFALVVYNLDRPEEGIGYQVMNYIVDGAPVYVTRASLTCDATPSMVTIGEHVTISGVTDPVRSGVDITLQQNTTSGWLTLNAASTDTTGRYSYVWTPSTSGIYHLRALIAGDETYNASLSSSQIITVDKRTQSVSCDVSASDITLDDAITISGALDPVQEGHTIDILYSSNGQTTKITTITTDNTGQYVHHWTPSATGTYQLHAVSPSDDIYHEATSSSILVTVNSQPMSQWLYLAPVLIIMFVGILFYQRSRMHAS